MLTLTHKLPRSEEFHIAVSGGIDSMCALDFLIKGKRYPKSVIYVNHLENLEFAASSCDTISKQLGSYRTQYNIRSIGLHVYNINPYDPMNGNKEAYWRRERYAAFRKVQENSIYPIVLGHQLDDCVEQYILSTIIRPSREKFIRYNGPSNTIRPFRLWSRKDIQAYAKNNKVQYVEDPTNSDTTKARSYIRNELMPSLLKLNPGLYTMVRRLIVESDAENKFDFLEI